MASCEQNNKKKIIVNQQLLIDKYKNTGFALIYTDTLKKEKKITKKIDKRSLTNISQEFKKKFFC